MCVCGGGEVSIILLFFLYAIKKEEYLLFIVRLLLHYISYMGRFGDFYEKLTK